MESCETSQNSRKVVDDVQSKNQQKQNRPTVKVVVHKTDKTQKQARTRSVQRRSISALTHAVGAHLIVTRLYIMIFPFSLPSHATCTTSMTASPNIIYKRPFILQLSASMILRRHYSGIYLLKNPCFMLCRWLRQLKVKKTAEVALGELCLSPKSVFNPAFRCITDKFLSYCRFPPKESVVYKWLQHPLSARNSKHTKAINVMKRAGKPLDRQQLI